MNQGECKDNDKQEIPKEIAKSVLIISQIIKWYARDFGGQMGTLAATKKYLPENDKRRKLIEYFGKVLMVRFAPYDWLFNGLG